MNTADKPAIAAKRPDDEHETINSAIARAAVNAAIARAAKPGVTTTEFWGSIVAAALPWISSTVPSSVRVIVSAAVAVAYTIGRSIIKARQ